MKRMIIVLCFVSFMINAIGQNVEWAIYDCPDAEEFHSGLATFKDETTGKWGAINTSGEIAISAKYDERLDFTGGYSIAIINGKYGVIDVCEHMLLDCIYKEMYRCSEKPEYIIVEDEKGKNGVFYNYRLSIPLTLTSCFLSDFPFWIIKEENKTAVYYNIANRKIYKSAYFDEAYKCILAKTKDSNIEFYLKDSGILLSINETVKSPNGSILFQDSMSNKWGVSFNGKTLVQPIYEIDYPIWSGTCIVLNNDKEHCIYSEKGKLIVKYNENDKLKYEPITSDYILVKEESSDLVLYGLIDQKGHIILNKIYKSIVHIKDKWFSLVDNNNVDIVFNAAEKKEYYCKYMPYDRFSENVIVVKDNNNSKYGYINLKTGESTGLKYYSVEPFREGIADVWISTEYGHTLIDENFNIILDFPLGSSVSIHGKPSEGVIAVSTRNTKSDDFEDRIYGYIYNPLGHGNYVYNNDNAQKIRCKDMFDQGLALFNKRKYVIAKDLFYQVMVLEPNNYEAIENYASCLNNMGYYDEAIQAHRMALDVNPNYELAAKNLEISLSNKNLPVQTTNSGTFWDALATFGKLAGELGQTFSSMKDFDTSQTYFDSEGGYSSSEADENEDPAAKGMSREAKANHYTSKYYSLESKVKNLFNSVTSHRSTTKDGKIQGTNTKTSVTDRGGDSEKKMIARYQAQMRQCRKLANYYGGHVAKSKYEDAKSSTLYL